jgi:hypothetical protein
MIYKLAIAGFNLSVYVGIFAGNWPTLFAYPI